MESATPSKTARKVALNIVTLGSHRPAATILPQGIVDATARLLVASGAVGPGGVWFSRSQMAVWIYLGFDWMMPGQFEAFAHRKAFCEHQVRKGLTNGARQVLVLGAGYDTLGWRLAPEFSDATFFEIDHPATSRLKSKGIENMGGRDNLELIAADLGEQALGDVLNANGRWDGSACSVIVAEGLLMYLSPEAVGTLLRQCAEASGAGSRMAFTFIGSTASGHPDAGPRTGMVMWMLENCGEPWLWCIRPDDLASFLQKNHWQMAGEDDFRTERFGVEYLGVALK